MFAVSPAAGAANPWTGAWIWSESPREDNYFRKGFVTPGSPEQAKLAITADNIYELYVNGVKVGSDADWTTLEVYDITTHVRAGVNVIAVKATDPGADVGALLVEAALTYPDGVTEVFGTDGTWKIAAEGPAGWTEPEFDDSAWQTPREIGKQPIGPWGGIDHPALAPLVPMEVVAVYWPKSANPGDTVSVTCKVRPLKPIVTDSPVCLRVLAHGETVCEQWIDPDTPVTAWTAGEVRTVVFPDFYLPRYVPQGKMQAQVVTTATESVGSPNIWVGPRTPEPKTPVVPAPTLSVRSTTSDGRRTLTVNLSVPVGAARFRYTFALFDGENMMLTAEIGPGESVLELPEEFPGGSYEARVRAHMAAFADEGRASARVRVSGPESTTWKPLGYGVYKDREGVPHRWHINPHGALIWDGNPYVPVGAMYLSRWFMDFNAADIAHNEFTYEDDLKRLRQMKEAGITDLYLNPCRNWKEKPAWVWQGFADMCEQVGINYGIQVTNHLAPLKAWHIAQDEYVTRGTGGETVSMNISGTWFGRTEAENRVLYAAFDPDTGDLADWGEAAVRPAAGGIEAEAAPKAETGRSLMVHFIPELTFRGDMHDYWTGIDEAYRAELDSFFSKLKLGPRFRLWIDPLDNEQSFRDMHRMLPHSAAFRAMFEDYLRRKYVRAQDAVDAWGIEGAGETNFASLARLIPLGKPSTESDIGYAVDEHTGRTYRIDLTRSAMWFDMLRFRDSSIAGFNNQVADMIKKHHDAPVVLKATDTDCFVNIQSRGGFDGLGMEAYGAAPELVRGCGGGVYSRCKQANRTMWTLVTETGLAAEHVGYPSPVDLVKELGSMAEMNAKGVFYFLLSAAGGRPGEGWYVFNLFEDPRQLHWLGAFLRIMKESDGLPNYEPETDYYFPGEIAGQRGGFSRAKPSFQSDIPSQSVAGDSGRWVVTTSTQIPRDAKRLIVNLEDSPATSIYGGQFEEALRGREVVIVGHRRNLGALSTDRYYTDKFVQDYSGIVYQVLSPTPTARILATASDGSVCGLEDGNLTIYSGSDWLRAVRKTAGPGPEIDFFADVLGIREPDVGRAFQALKFGDTLFLWNMTDSEHVLALEDRPETRLTPPPAARKPVIVENVRSPRIIGTDAANLQAAVNEWTKARYKAASVGIEANVIPDSGDWRDIYRQADELLRRAADAYRTATARRMDKVNVDGELSEWSGVTPIFLAMDVGVDFAQARDYEGARFYLGYDERYLYVAGEVKDEAIVNNYRLGNLWNGDAVEVFIDLYPDADPGMHNYNRNCFQFIFAPTSIDGVPGSVVINPDLPPDSAPRDSLWAVRQTETGWTFEAAIGKGDLNEYAFREGAVIGFTIQLGDSDGGDRTSARLWRGGKNASRNRLDFGRLALGGVDG